MIKYLINVETLENENSIMSRLRVFSIFSISIFSSSNKGHHLSFALGVGPIEAEWTIRLWLTEIK